MNYQILQPQIRKKLAIGLIAASICLFATYIYLLSASVLHVVMRGELEHQVRELRSEIALLESDFIAAQHAVSETIATLEGYEKVHEKVFIDRNAPSLVLNTLSTKP